MKLKIDSICLISAIVDKLEIDDKFIEEMVALGKTGKGKSKDAIESLKEKIGIKIVVRIGSKIHLVRDELVKFISVYKEISEKEAINIDIKEIIKELMNDEDFVSFFKQKVISK